MKKAETPPPSAPPAPVFTMEIEEAFAQLQRTGLFGTSRAEVISTLVREKLRELTLQGWCRLK